MLLKINKLEVNSRFHLLFVSRWLDWDVITEIFHVLLVLEKKVIKCQNKTKCWVLLIRDMLTDMLKNEAVIWLGFKNLTLLCALALTLACSLGSHVKPSALQPTSSMISSILWHALRSISNARWFGLGCWLYQYFQCASSDVGSFSSRNTKWMID